MKIAELKDRYPHIKFYELDKVLGSERIWVKKLDDFLELTKMVGYVETVVSSEEASERVLDCAMDAYINMNDEIYKFDNIINYIKANMRSYITKEIKELTKCDAYTITTLYGIGLPIVYEEEVPFISEENFNKAVKKIDAVYRDYKNGLEQKKEMHDQDIHNCIMDYKEKYEKANTKAEKTLISQKVQRKLYNKYGINYRGDFRARREYIMQLFETTEKE